MDVQHGADRHEHAHLSEEAHLVGVDLPRDASHDLQQRIPVLVWRAAEGNRYPGSRMQATAPMFTLISI